MASGLRRATRARRTFTPRSGSTSVEVVLDSLSSASLITREQILGWFIFTFILWLLTLRSTVIFSSLFLMVWLAFLTLGCAYLDAANQPDGMPNIPLTRAGGAFGIVAGFIAWYNMLAGLADPSNSFFVVPVLHFPWSDKGRAAREVKQEDARSA